MRQNGKETFQIQILNFLQTAFLYIWNIRFFEFTGLCVGIFLLETKYKSVHQCSQNCTKVWTKKVYLKIDNLQIHIYNIYIISNNLTTNTRLQREDRKQIGWYGNLPLQSSKQIGWYGNLPLQTSKQIGWYGNLPLQTIKQIGWYGNLPLQTSKQIGWYGNLPLQTIKQIGWYGNLPLQTSKQIGWYGNLPLQTIKQIGWYGNLPLTNYQTDWLIWESTITN